MNKKIKLKEQPAIKTTELLGDNECINLFYCSNHFIVYVSYNVYLNLRKNVFFLKIKKEKNYLKKKEKLIEILDNNNKIDAMC